jgi:hypothetical protein
MTIEAHRSLAHQRSGFDFYWPTVIGGRGGGTRERIKKSVGIGSQKNGISQSELVMVRSVLVSDGVPA